MAYEQSLNLSWGSKLLIFLDNVLYIHSTRLLDTSLLCRIVDMLFYAHHFSMDPRMIVGFLPFSPFCTLIHRKNHRISIFLGLRYVSCGLYNVHYYHYHLHSIVFGIFMVVAICELRCHCHSHKQLRTRQEYKTNQIFFRRGSWYFIISIWKVNVCQW